jgi:hypothetical protein
MILNGNLVLPFLVRATLQNSPADNRILLWSRFPTSSSLPEEGVFPLLGFCATGSAAMKLRFDTWKRFTLTGLRLPFKKSVNLPLSSADREEILEAYETAAVAIKASAASLEALTEMLEQKLACLDSESRKALDNPFALVGSSLFKLGVLRFKIENANFSGREFSALPESTSPEP